MKPRRHLTSVDLLPTILELQESQSLDDYIDSIQELSQPTYPLSGPLRGSRLSPLRMAKHPSMSLATTGSVLGPASSNQDPLDWLFAQVQTDPEDVCMMETKMMRTHKILKNLSHQNFGLCTFFVLHMCSSSSGT
uniref:DEPP1 autophagy regulator n=1 Tax=Sinocyclocheilus anshuiensis TaxID=1608454 RepID=A0A671KIF9_9TELE